MRPWCLHTVFHYLGLYIKSLAQKLTEKNAFFVKFMYVTFCDLHSHCRSQVMVRNERLYIYEFLSMNNCNHRPIWHRY